jgi:hypothetical protein
MNDQNQVRKELIELLHEIVDVLESEKSMRLTDENVLQYQARAARIEELSEKIREPQSR